MFFLFMCFFTDRYMLLLMLA